MIPYTVKTEVTFSYTITKKVEIEVEADDADQAEDFALDEIRDNHRPDSWDIRHNSFEEVEFDDVEVLPVHAKDIDEHVEDTLWQKIRRRLTSGPIMQMEAQHGC